MATVPPFFATRAFIYTYMYRAAYTRGPRLDNTWRENVFGAVAVDVVEALGLDRIDRRY